MPDQLRAPIADCLRQHQIAVLSTTGKAGIRAMPVHYRLLAAAGSNHRLEVACLLPRWADAIYYLEQDPHVSLVIHALRGDRLWWLAYRGTAHPAATPDWSAWSLPAPPAAPAPEVLYTVIHVTPERIEVVDESQGWGARETLDL